MNISKNEIMSKFNYNKILIQMLVTKVNKMQKTIETLEKKNDNNLNENIISILANYENKIEILEQKINNLEALLINNKIEYNQENSLNF